MTVSNNSLGRLSFGPTAGKVVMDGLVLYADVANRRSYVGGGTTWSDLSGQGNDFTIVGSVAFNEKYFTLNGSTSQYVQANPFPHPTGDFTIELYERINTFNNTPLYSYAVSGDSNEGLLYAPDGLIFIYGPSGGTSTGYTINSNQFYQIVRARKINEDTFEDILYVNGEKVATRNTSKAAVTTAGGSLNVGQEQDSPGGGFDPTQTLNGDVAIVRVYNRTLSSEEINNNYDNTKSRFAGD